MQYESAVEGESPILGKDVMYGVMGQDVMYEVRGEEMWGIGINWRNSIWSRR
jgi:hypothetical protein